MFCRTLIEYGVVGKLPKKKKKAGPTSMGKAGSCHPSWGKHIKTPAGCDRVVIWRLGLLHLQSLHLGANFEAGKDEA